MMYTFNSLSEYLDHNNYPKIDGSTGFEIIRTNFEEAYKDGRIEFRDDGVYLINGDKEWRGYMFMPTYYIERYDSFPRIHLRRCDVIDKFLNRGVFNTYYEWSNSDKNDITDRDTQQVHLNHNLNVCNRCKAMMLEEIKDSEEFFDTLEKGQKHEPQLEVDIFGYERDWNRKSKDVKKKKNYTCEECKVKIDEGFDQRFLHVHHLHGKENNSIENLKCLCILCHKYQDTVHEKNFSTASANSTITAFIEKYGDKLNQSLVNKFNSTN